MLGTWNNSRNMVDESDIYLENQTRIFKRATIKHSEFGDAQIYCYNVTLEKVVAFFKSIGVDYNSNSCGVFAVSNTQNKIIQIRVEELDSGYHVVYM